eukprot:gb/GEZN01005097.1/.p1 GENE.gb/GEZN01005097.1/~~gb/GEZN01005097.1/.p1  ORF type:complete len:491 (-),score=70.39 gb/GEZN01005097.1/:154-1626(-)
MGCGISKLPLEGKETTITIENEDKETEGKKVGGEEKKDAGEESLLQVQAEGTTPSKGSPSKPKWTLHVLHRPTFKHDPLRESGASTRSLYPQHRAAKRKKNSTSKPTHTRTGSMPLASIEVLFENNQDHKETYKSIKEKQKQIRESRQAANRKLSESHIAEALEKQCSEYKDICQENLKGTEGSPFIEYSVRSQQGFIPRLDKPNQDRAVALWPYMNQPARAFFGVFDGHGPFGHCVSSFVSSHLPDLFAKHLQARGKDEIMASVAAKAFHECNELLLSTDLDLDFSGSTGVVVYIDGTTLWSFNVGDSRAVVARKQADPDPSSPATFVPLPLTRDHKPYVEDEKERIEKAGGRCERPNDSCKIENCRVWLKDVQIPGLAVSRAFGDKCARQVGVDAIPEILETRIEAGVHAFLILASDGIWEFLSNVDVVHWAAENPTSMDVCQDLIAEANEIWAEEDESRDDITLITVFLHGYTPPKTKPVEEDEEGS